MPRFNSLTDWLDWQEGFHPRTIDLGLKRVSAVYKALNPSTVKPLTITVAGTNGKGSCIAFLEAFYRSQGYKVGTYTSPHITEYNERIKIDGKPVSNNLICQAFDRIDTQRNDTSLSYFEFGTLAALDIFWRSELDIQLLEVGLGGRLDAVNIIDPDVALITSICIDHIDWLGETREAIGFEKAGIFRPDVPAVMGDINPPKSMIENAKEKNTPLLRINHEFSFKKNGNNWDWFSNYNNQHSYKSLPSPALKGEHQLSNAATSIMAVTALQNSLPISEDSIRKGLQTTTLKGRFQLIEGDIPILLDVAHNPHAVNALLNYLNESFSGKIIYAVFSMMKDKDIKGVIEIINPVVNQWFISPLSNPRTASQTLMGNCFKTHQIDNASFGYKDFSEAFNDAKSHAKKGDLILIFGSFFLVSEYFKANA